MRKIFYTFIFLFLAVCFFYPNFVLAHQPRLIYFQEGSMQIKNPDISQAFYDELKGEPRDYFINSEQDFQLYLNLLVPAYENASGRYSAKVFLLDNSQEQLMFELSSDSSEWKPFYEEFGRDWYLKGPEILEEVLAGKYKIEVYSYSTNLEQANLGKYVLSVGKKEVYGAGDLLSVYWQLPLLKLTFFKTSVMQFFLTPFGIAGVGAIGGLLILIALIYYFVGIIKTAIKHRQAKTLLLSSNGMLQMQDEIIKLLQKPAYNVTVGFITTAYKFEHPNENPDWVQTDLSIMKELGFNVEEFDIEGKTEREIMNFLETKDIIYVEGGNTFYLLKVMRKCKFEKILRKLLKQGKVYMGVSAGSIVAGKTIEIAGWKNNKNTIGLRNLKGLNLVPFDIFVHYQPEHAELIKQKIPNQKKRLKKLRILTDEQAFLVQGKEIDLIGEGEAIVI